MRADNHSHLRLCNTKEAEKGAPCHFVSHKSFSSFQHLQNKNPWQKSCESLLYVWQSLTSDLITQLWFMKNAKIVLVQISSPQWASCCAYSLTSTYSKYAFAYSQNVFPTSQKMPADGSLRRRETESEMYKYSSRRQNKSSQLALNIYKLTFLQAGIFVCLNFVFCKSSDAKQQRLNRSFVIQNYFRKRLDILTNRADLTVVCDRISSTFI